MYNEISKLILYGNNAAEKFGFNGYDKVLYELGLIYKDFDNDNLSDSDLIQNIYALIKELLILSTDFGFDKNLWQNYLTFLLITNENPFSITCEKVGANDGSVNQFAKNDFRAFKNLFNFDFSKIEKKLNIDCFSIITNYHAIGKKELMYNKNVSEKVQALSCALAESKDEHEFFNIVTKFYKDYGVGMLGLNKAFRLGSNENEPVTLRAINNMDKVMLEDLVGYEYQKHMLIENTESFVQGRKANNALLYGDSGTGKSTSIKAIVNKYYDQGLRMIEIYKHQFKDLSSVIAMIKNRNYKFIIYMDDLSFEEFETEYKFLKAVIEGGVETKPENILIYATSNRRHLVKETWKDRNDMETIEDVHRSDSVEEKTSLASRFGCRIYYGKPTRDEYHSIVKELAIKNGLTISEDVLIAEANKWELRHGGISGRTAQQFINYNLGMQK